MNLSIRTMQPGDADQVDEIERDYHRAHPDADFVTAETYLSPFFGDGANVLCAVHGSRVLGHAALNANLVMEGGRPHTVWARILTRHPETREIRKALLDGASDRAREIGAAVPGHETRLTFQFYSSEVEGISFVESIGARHTKTGFRMAYRITKAPLVPSSVPGIKVRNTRLETLAEQESYAAERSRAFPDQPLTVGDWQKIAASPLFRDGTTFTAFANGGVVGSVALYRDPRHRQTAHTEDIFVKDGWRRRGIAHYLIAHALVYLREHGVKEAVLDVDASNIEALGVYRSMGYAVVGESRIYVVTL